MEAMGRVTLERVTLVDTGLGSGEDIMTYNLTTWTLAPGAGEEG